eukprot:Skav219561  [mRNA]  locus=scaffold886:25793:30121:- [translate_table: standard]
MPWRNWQEIEAGVAPPPWRPEVEYHLSEVAPESDGPLEAPPFESSPDVAPSAFAAPADVAPVHSGIAPPAGIGGIAPPAGMGGIAPPAGFASSPEVAEVAHVPSVPAVPAVPTVETMAAVGASVDRPIHDGCEMVRDDEAYLSSVNDGNDMVMVNDDLVGEIMAATSKESGGHRLLEYFHCIGCDFKVGMVCGAVVLALMVW